MRAKLVVFAMSASVLLGQDVARVFQLHHMDAEKDQYEFATLVRTISDTRQVSADVAQKTVSVRGTATQIAIAEWLFTELDRQTVPDSVSQEFRVANDADDVVRLFFLPNTATIQDFQEIATTIRTIAEIRRVFAYNTPRAMAVRGTADQMAAAAFMIRELDQPASAKRADSRVYQIIDTGNRGETAVRDNMFIPILLNGVLVDQYFSYSLVPVYENGRVAGIYDAFRNMTRPWWGLANCAKVRPG